MDFPAFIRSFKQNLDTPCAFLLGAGASISSGVMSAGDCIWDWKKQIYLSQNSTHSSFLDIHSDTSKEKIQQWLDEQGGYPKLNSEEEYVFYAEHTFPLESDRTKYFENLCHDKQPYVGYKLLCLLHRYGVLKSVWTTNFDGLTERAAHQANITPINVNLSNPDNINRRESTNELLCIALHGDYKYSSLKNAKHELDSQNDKFVERLKSYFVERNLVVIGYSGRDKSLMYALQLAFTSPGSGRLYWCGYGASVSQNVCDLLSAVRRTGREAVYINTDGFDKTLISLLQTCYSDDPEKEIEIRGCMSGENQQDNLAPFTIPQLIPTGTIRTNLYPVILPKNMYQFEVAYPVGVKHWSFIKEHIMGHNIVVAPIGEKVCGFAYAETIHELFDNLIKGDVCRTPLSLDEIKRSGALKSVVLKTLLCGISEKSGLRASMSTHLLWDENKVYSRNPLCYEAIKLGLSFKDGANYVLLSINPTVKFDESSGKLSDDTKKEIVSSYLAKLRNRDYNNLIVLWESKLFMGNRIQFNFPKESHNPFIFQIGCNCALAGIDYTDKGLTESIATSKQYIYNGLCIEEPELEYTGVNPDEPQYDQNPMRGLINNRPYDYAFYQAFGTNINIGVICPESHTVQLSDFLNGLNRPLFTNQGKDYVQPYKGFEDIYSCKLNIPAVKSNKWITCRTHQPDSVSLAGNICQNAHKMAESTAGIVIVIFIPSSWSTHRSFSQDGEVFDLHNYIKAYGAQHGFTTQIIEEKTIFNTTMKTEVYWWLSLALFVKSKRIPWALAHMKEDTAYAGIGYSLKKDHTGKSYVVVGCSHIYNNKGQGLRYKLSKINNPLFDSKRNPYLNYNEAYKLGISIQELFIKSMDQLPKRVVVHKRTPFHEDEIQGILDALGKANITDVDLITITIENSIRGIDQFWSNGHPSAANYPIIRGVCIPVGDHDCLLWTHGTVDSVRSGRSYYSGGRGIPTPLRITKYHGSSSMQTIASEILGFTKMNWNSFNFYTKLPATIDTSNTLAQVGNLLRQTNGVTYDYRYFI